jgi:hypothetical protein
MPCQKMKRKSGMASTGELVAEGWVPGTPEIRRLHRFPRIHDGESGDLTLLYMATMFTVTWCDEASDVQGYVR